MKWLVLLFIFISVAIAETAFAQVARPVQLNIILHEVQHLSVNPEQSTTNLEYKTVKDYQEGVSKTQNNHLTVLSTTPYIIKVQVMENEQQAGASASVSSPSLELFAQPTNSTFPVHTELQQLSTKDASLISSDHPSTGTYYDVIYKSIGQQSAIDFIKNNEKTTYSNTILYSIESK
ncbi:hypothetical protein ACR78F_01735 [Sphingobacterium spiritivorum]|uniref:hypothetical protein n=1 Tax=Sphingobacterium spiritivorum TaxID=258 RepID=UPI003DA56E41